ncbi:unnamed protein product [Vicia faba]|uniref:DUF7356 domain-containing protein n=1 Tax=Vicia faba TaxID=3906 RepID=A0AAV1AV36_VICFA|nr:unnamed protein product [Vicia faba]
MGRHTLLKLLLFSLIVFHGVESSFVRKLIDSIPIKDSPDLNNKVGEEKKKEIDANVSSVPPPQSLPKVENVNNRDVNQKENSSTSITPPPVPVNTITPPVSVPVTATTPPPPPVPVPVTVTTPPPPPVPVPVTAPPPHVPATAPPPVPKKTEDGVDGGKDQEEKKVKEEEVKFSHSTTNDTCEGLNTCTDDGVMAACISNKDSKNLVVLLRNKGDGSIKVKLRSDYESNLGDVEVDKNKTEKVTIKRIHSENTQLTLDAGKGDCVLHTATPIPESYFLHFPSYDKILTPINGAYFLIFAVLVFGGICACCMFRKKHRDEIPYQELEMALPESAAATNMESAEGWDQVWDDDWDDNVAVKSPSVRHAGSISANGLTARSLNKDGWEDNWDD